MRGLYRLLLIVLVAAVSAGCHPTLILGGEHYHGPGRRGDDVLLPADGHVPADALEGDARWESLRH